MTGATLLSVIVPAYNEQQNVRPVYDAICAAFQGPESLEIIFVDDGSSDSTAFVVRLLHSADPRVRLIRFGRNFGQQAALMAGLEAARGAAAITLDCDLQHPPKFLPAMIDKWKSGAKVVQMVRLHTEGASWFKRLSSKLFYLIVNLLSDTPVTSGAADYQLLDRLVVDAVLQFRDRQPFVRGLVGWLGFESVRIDYVAPDRQAGSAAYGTRKMLRLSLEAITSLSSKPLRVSFYVGCVAALFSLVYGAYAIASYAAGETIPGWTSVFVMVTFLGAVQLISVGIIGEYLARVYQQIRNVPRFVVVESYPDVPLEPPG